MAYKMKGFPMHSTKSALKQTKSPFKQDDDKFKMQQDIIPADATATYAHWSKNPANFHGGGGGSTDSDEKLEALLAAFDKKYPMEGPIHPDKVAEIKEKRNFLIEDFNELQDLKQSLDNPIFESPFGGTSITRESDQKRASELQNKLDNFLMESTAGTIGEEMSDGTSEEIEE
tara:strand:+ start:167 stop:685 length:519 start_codon:yes stop_codon:yes gene_type:complete